MKKHTLYSAYSKNKGVSPITVILFIILVIYVLGLFVPIIWAFISSFWNYQDYKIFYNFKAFDKIKFPVEKTLENYKYAWENLKVTTTETDKHPEATYEIGSLFKHSLIYSIGCAAVSTLVPCCVAYASARFKFRFSKIIYAFVLFAMALPVIGSTSSELRMLKSLNLDGTFLGIFVLRAHFLTIYTLIFYAQFEAIPLDYSEAAKVDGASNLRIMLRVIFPQALNTIVTVFILNFIGFWNEYQVPLLYLPEYPTIGYCMFYFIRVSQSGSITSYIPVQMAGTIILTLPILLVFIIFNKRLRVGVSMGGIKG